MQKLVEDSKSNTQEGKKDKSRGSKILILIAIILLLLLLLTMCSGLGSGRDKSGNVTFGVIDVDDDSNSGVDLQGLANSIVDENMFQVFINTEMVVESNGNVDFMIRLLAKLSKSVKIADTSDQRKAESKTFSAIAITFREDTKPFHKANGVFNKDTFL